MMEMVLISVVDKALDRRIRDALYHLGKVLKAPWSAVVVAIVEPGCITAEVEKSETGNEACEEKVPCVEAEAELSVVCDVNELGERMSSVSEEGLMKIAELEGRFTPNVMERLPYWVLEGLRDRVWNIFCCEEEKMVKLFSYEKMDSDGDSVSVEDMVNAVFCDRDTDGVGGRLDSNVSLLVEDKGENMFSDRYTEVSWVKRVCSVRIVSNDRPPEV